MVRESLMISFGFDSESLCDSILRSLYLETEGRSIASKWTSLHIKSLFGLTIISEFIELNC